MKLQTLFILAITGLLLTACSAARRLEADQYLLVRNRIIVEPEVELARTERITKDELSSYIRQRPNKRLLGVPLYLHIHNLSPSDKQNWIKRIGEAPVVYDPALTERSVTAMSIDMQGRGFLNSTVTTLADTVGKRKIGVQYRVAQGAPSRIGTIVYDFEDTFVEPLVLEDSAATLLRSGDIFSTSALQAERQRITDHLKGLGYYNFSINNILYPVDTVSNPGSINVKIRVRRRVAGYDQADQPVMENNKIYRLRNIYVMSDYDAALAASDPAYTRGLDTLEYRGVRFLFRHRQNVRPDVLMRAIDLYPNDLYDAGRVNRAYDNLMKLNYFRSASILFTELADSLGAQVTYIGDPDASGNVTQEGFLDCTIRCTPGKRQAYSVDLEVTTTSTYYGLLATLGYQNRNLLRGAEAIDLRLTTGYEFMHVPGRKNSIELGGTVGISFPRFITPWRVDRYNRMNNVRTRVEASVNYQDRPFYTRTLTSANWGYSWSNSRFSSYTLRPVDISVVNVSRLDTSDSSYYANLTNAYLINSFKSQLIAGISGSYTYNNQVAGENSNSFRLRLNAETNGNLLGLLSPVAFQKILDANAGKSYHRIFGIRYAQYVRADLDMSYRLVTGRKTALAARFYIGAGHSYGNSAGLPIPFERQFYAGGPNSMRGWAVRTLGQGSVLANEYLPSEEGGTAGQQVTYPAQVGNFKLETNLEYRFPVYKFLNGALFADLGNIWVIGSRNLSQTPEAYFKFNRFYDQLALNTGLGARMDFGFFLFRIDWGVRLHDPNKPSGQKWTQHLTLRNTAFNFSVGYPF